MGTRSLTEIVDGNGVIATMYRQFDGYLTGHGTELYEKFGNHTLVNGLREKKTNIANGMGCLAAQIVRAFKDAPGNIYLYPPGSRDCGEEYVYILSAKDDAIWLEIYEGGVTYFGASQVNAGLDDQRPEAAKPIYAGKLADFDAEECEQKYHAA